MRHISWLISTTLLATSALAFYPYHGNPNLKTDSANMPSLSAINGEFTDSQSPTIEIKKRWRNRPKRDNKYPVSIASPPTLPNSMAISQDGQDYSYFSAIKLGSKGKDMWMLIDSGSANTWVFGSDCESQACKNHNTFGSSDSDTLNMSSADWSLTYGTGDVGGVVASDKFAFAGFDVDIGFGLALNASDEFTTYPMDGILGLGRDSSNRLGTPTLMDVMADQKLLKANMFGILLSRSADGRADGQITFGGADTSKFSGELSYTDSISIDGLWEIPTDGAAVDNHSVGLTGKTAIIDTGTSYILMPLNDAKALHARLPGSLNHGDTFTIPCNTSLPIQLTFSEVSYEVLAMDYVGEADKTGKMCRSKIVGRQAFGTNTWVLGAAFLKNVYTVFDFDNHRIGFGKMSTVASTMAAKSPSSPTTTSTGMETSTSSATVSHATAMGATEGGSGTPSPPTLAILLSICLSMILSVRIA